MGPKRLSWVVRIPSRTPWFTPAIAVTHPSRSSFSKHGDGFTTLRNTAENVSWIIAIHAKLRSLGTELKARLCDPNLGCSSRIGWRREILVAAAVNRCALLSQPCHEPFDEGHCGGGRQQRFNQNGWLAQRHGLHHRLTHPGSAWRGPGRSGRFRRWLADLLPPNMAFATTTSAPTSPALRRKVPRYAMRGRSD